MAIQTTPFRSEHRDRILVKFNYDWDFEGYKIWDRADWNKYVRACKMYMTEYSTYKGNYFFLWDTPEDHLGDFEVVEVEENDLRIIEETVGSEFGTFLYEEEFWNDAHYQSYRIIEGMSGRRI